MLDPVVIYQLPGLRVVPQQRRPGPHQAPVSRPAPSPHVKLRSLIYAFPVYAFELDTGLMSAPDPATGQREIWWGYVGQTIRGRQVREAEHLDDKPWADLVAGPSVIVERGEWDKDERDTREILAIKKIRPYFNHDHNLDNPRRVPLWDPAKQSWVQIAQRHARDRAAGRELWLTPLQRLDAERNSVTVLEAHRRRTDRTPAEFVWDVACATARWVARWPRRLQLTVLALVLWAWGVWGTASLLIAYAQWPPPVAWVFATVLNTVALIGPLRSRPVRRWVKRRRR